MGQPELSTERNICFCFLLGSPRGAAAASQRLLRERDPQAARAIDQGLRATPHAAILPGRLRSHDARGVATVRTTRPGTYILYLSLSI